MLDRRQGSREHLQAERQPAPSRGREGGERPDAGDPWRGSLAADRSDPVGLGGVSMSLSETTLSRELRALGYRKLSARPRHDAQNPEALEVFKKASRPRWRRSGRASRRACVDAPSGARRIFGQLRRGIGCCHVSGLCCGGSQAAGPYGSSWIRATSPKRARSALPSPGSPDPASPTFAPYLSFDLLTPSTASRPPTAYAATAGAR